LGKKPDRATIDGNGINRFFGGATVSNKNNDTALPAAAAAAAKENINFNSNSTTNNHPNVNSDSYGYSSSNNKTKKNKWNTNMFATKNIFLKQNQEKNFEISIVA